MKIAISGAGIAGPTLAYWLARSGHDPVLIETAPQLRTGGYLVDFWGAGYAVAERMGLAPAVQRAGYAIEEVRLIDRSGDKAGGFAVGPVRRALDGRFTSVPRGELTRLIYGAIEGDVETVFNDRITAIDERDDGVQVTFEHARRREFDLVMGADGIHSPVRDLVFGPHAVSKTNLGYWVAACEADGYRPRDELAYVAYTRPGRMVTRFAMRNDRTLFLFVFADEMSRPIPVDKQDGKAVLQQVFAADGWECPQILSVLARVDDLYFDRVSQIRLDCWSKGRVALAGDAASCVSLLGGEGTGLAMLQAYVLAGELNKAGTDHREAFRCYEQRLRPLVQGRQRSARAFATAFAPKTPLGLWTRNRVSRLLDVRALADWAIRREFSDDVEVPQYAM